MAVGFIEQLSYDGTILSMLHILTQSFKCFKNYLLYLKGTVTRQRKRERIFSICWLIPYMAAIVRTEPG